jgi:membrane-bound acyltransferase YfiQ involved in biofilm formation
VQLSTVVGLLLLVIFFVGNYLRIRARRRSGEVQSFGHPVLDNLLLLASALVIIALLVLTRMLFHKSWHSIGARYFGDAALLSVAAVLTWLCNGMLRRSKRHK